MISLSLTRARHQSAAAAAARAVISFRDDERLVVDLDAGNADYLRAAVTRRGKHAFDWVETADGFLIGVDVAAIQTIDWHPPDGPAPSWLDRDHLALRFCTGRADRFGHIAPDDIDRLRGATLGGCAGKRFKPDAGTGAAPIPLQGLCLATLPACWMDAEEG
jgi:hypothetical protein